MLTDTFKRGQYGSRYIKPYHGDAEKIMGELEDKRKRRDAIRNLKPAEAEQRKRERIAELRRQIAADKQRIADAEAEIKEWEKL